MTVISIFIHFSFYATGFESPMHRLLLPLNKTSGLRPQKIPGPTAVRGGGFWFLVKISFWSKLVFGQLWFLVKLVFGQNWFLVKICFWSKSVFGQNRFLVKIGYGLKSVFGQNWFLVKIGFYVGEVAVYGEGSGLWAR
ncbi:MAG: hypothetical protein GY823_11645 [Flavobacteriaceae bacterium]|nr:hypothetical protein [Flavobacteriaceae bacterium]